ncbi:TPA: LacI family DNA-binding transcriptional regulator, partial [Salmonella enterica subsp. enterica serovar Aberdeen]|nr:LacI family DNA-binding transcriptional regulator [Escherichia coli]HBJ6658415.1 LacI family DNA-binding transcriptional regulator [Salmonella enterica subsp. enterica serovar Aberdeen]
MKDVARLAGVST